MGSFIAVLAAFTTIFMNDQIFRTSPAITPGPLLSSYIFLIALFLLLCELPMYPSSLRKLGFLVQGIFELLVAAFIAEGIVVDFWLPLEAAAMDNVPKLADVIDDMLSNDDWKCEMFNNTFRNTKTRYAISYSLSIFFLMTVLHATRIIDLRVLDAGLGYFIKDNSSKFKQFIKRQFKLAIIKKLETDVTIDDESIINEVVNANPRSGGSFSENNIEGKSKIPRKKRNQRIIKVSPGNDGDKSNKNEAGKRQTRSSTWCSDKQPVIKKSIF